MNKIEFKKLDKEQMIIAFNQLKDDYNNKFKECEQKDKAIDECIEFVKSKFWEDKGSGYNFDERYCDYGADFIDNDYDALLEKLQQVKGGCDE